MRNLILILIATFLLSTSAAWANNCSCPPVTLENSQKIVDESYAVFSGEIIEAYKDEFYEIKIDKLYKIDEGSLFPAGAFFEVNYLRPNENLNVENRYLDPKCDREKYNIRDKKDFIIFRDKKIEKYRSILTNQCAQISPEMWKKLKSSPLNKSDIRTYLTEECNRRGGALNYWALGKIDCNIPTKDKGSFCNSEDDCEGLCLAIKSNPINILSFIKRIHFGKCSKYKKLQTTLDKDGYKDKCNPLIWRGSVDSGYCARE